MGTSMANAVRCTMVAEHVLDERKGITTQEFQTYVRYGDVYKNMVDVKRLEQTPLDLVAGYNCLDVRYLSKWYADQDTELTGGLRDAYDFFHRAIPHMITLKQRGIKVDDLGLISLGKTVDDEIAELEKGLEADCLKRYEKEHGGRFDVNSPQSKAKLFYGTLGLRAMSAPGKSGFSSVDKEALEYIQKQVRDGSDGDRLIKLCLEKGHLTKLKGTYIDGLVKLLDDENFLHPSFLLHRAQTYRSSSADPNFQNIPNRNPTLARVRRYMIPRHDWMLEVDYAGAEVRMIGMYSGDGVLIGWIKNDVDFHRYWASRLLKIPEEDVANDERFDGKSGFVFPIFYGSYYKNIAAQYPQWHGEGHVRDVEEELRDTLKVTMRWQRELVTFYETHGYVETKLGFRRHGPMKKNEVINTPIQATAFHRLLLALMDAEDEMRDKDMQSIIVGQIHDSIVADVLDEELEEVIEILEGCMTRRVWDWDNGVPMAAEFKIGKNFLEMGEL